MISPILWQVIPFRDKDAWLDFLGQHAATHIALYQRIVQLLAKPAYTTYPLADGGGQTWLLANQQEHTNLCASLGITGPPDMTGFELDKEQEFDAFMLIHAGEHSRIATAAGLV